MVQTEKSKSLNIHEKINIRSRYSDVQYRNYIPYQMTFGFLDIWTWNLQPYFNNKKYNEKNKPT